MILILVLLFSAPNAHSTSVTDSLYQVAIALPDSLPIKQRIKAIKNVLKRNHKYAPAHNQLAWLYLKQGKPSTRQSARFAIEKAIVITPNNVDYKITKGAVLWSQGFYEDAVDHYKDVLKNHPDCSDAAYWLGYYYLNEFMDTKDRREYQKSGAGDGGVTGFTMKSRNRDAGITRMERQARLTSGAIIGFSEEAKEDLKTAINYLERSIQIAPDFRDAYYKLGLAHLENGQPEQMLASMDRILKRFPDDKDALLFSGLGSIAMGSPGKAAKFFETAFEHMSFEERSVLENIELIVSKKKKDTLSQAFTSVSDNWVDPPEFAHFWLSQDPLFLTPYNERRLEHYARLAYSNLWFSLPRANIEGWRTDRGKTYIKYGRYRYRRSSSRGEAWVYEGFQFDFRNPIRGSLGGRIFNWETGDILPRMAGPYMRDPWELVNASAYKREMIEEERYNSYIRLLLERPAQPSLRERFKKIPARYIDPYKRQRYSLPHLITAFREQDSIRFEIAYAVPKRRIKTMSDGNLGIIDGVFLFNQDWEETYRDPAVVTLPAPADTTQVTTPADSLRKSYFTTQHTVRTVPGQYTIAAEVVDQKSGSIGAFRTPYEPEGLTDGFAMSDLLLARQITPKNDFPESRKDLLIDANPLRTFHPSEPVYIYLELYDLKRDNFGHTKYEIAYQIGRPKNKTVDPSLFTDLNLPEGQIEIRLIEQPGKTPIYDVSYTMPKRNLITDWKEIKRSGVFRKRPGTTITAQYEGENKNDFTYLQIDVSQVPPGVHQLTVSVRDLRTKQKSQRDLLFRVTQ